MTLERTTHGKNAEQQRRRRIRRPRPHSLTNEANEYELDVWLVLPSLIGSYLVPNITSPSIKLKFVSAQISNYWLWNCVFYVCRYGLQWRMQRVQKVVVTQEQYSQIDNL